MEIGSEYYTASAVSGINHYKELVNFQKRYVLSGRTGLHLIAEELKYKLKCCNILLPNYCCGSMIYPFIHQGFTVSFYEAFGLKNVSLDDMADAVLIMDYFGFISEDTLCFVQKCKSKGKTVIVDATQTAFSLSPTYEIADYLIVSYKKWFDCLCCAVYSKDGFITNHYSKEHDAYNRVWRRAASLKKGYIRSGEGEKQEFLSLYAEANHMLEAKYESFSANKKEIALIPTIDSSALRSRRRENAETLIKGIMRLSESYDIRLLYSSIHKEDCPLFVPILVEEDKRNLIRSELSRLNIYCPCHWPIDHRYPFEEHLYHRTEVSLICDQRYGNDDMWVQLKVFADVLKLVYKY